MGTKYNPKGSHKKWAEREWTQRQKTECDVMAKQEEI